MFNFRIITTADGNQIIDRSLKTPYNALTPTQMLEYTDLIIKCFLWIEWNANIDKRQSI